MATFQTAYESLMDQCNRPLSESAVLARAKLEVNNAIRVLQRRHAFRDTERLFTFTYPASTRVVSFSSICDGTLRDLKSVQAFASESSTDGLVLSYKPYGQIIQERSRYQRKTSSEDSVEQLSTESGRGHNDYVSRNHRFEVFALGPNVGLYPKPASNVFLEVNCHVWLPDLEDDDDTNFFLDYAFDVVLALAASFMSTYLKNPELKSFSNADLEIMLLSLVAWDSQRHESSYVQLS